VGMQIKEKILKIANLTISMIYVNTDYGAS
jgi:hypothetical protein